MVSINKNCINILIKLVLNIKKILQEYSEGNIKVKNWYFKIHVNRNAKGLSLSAEPFLKEVPNEFLISDVYSKLNRINKELMDAANKCLYQAIGIEDGGTIMIYSFVRIIAKKLIEDGLVCDKKIAEELVQQYLDILSGKSIERFLVSIIVGIEPSNVVQIDDFIKIRRVVPEDIFDKEMSYEDYYMKHTFLFTILSQGSATIRFKFRDKKDSFPTLGLNAILYLLKLYKLGSIKEICRIDVTITPLWVKKFFEKPLFPAEISIPPTVDVAFKYKVYQEEIDDLKEFIKGNLETMIKILSSKGVKNPIKIALERYNKGLFSETAEERVAYAIMGLEALFLRGGELEELSRRLAQRVARILGIIGFDSIDVYNIIKKGYRIRSAYVHGSAVKIDQTINTHAKVIMEYLRISIILMIKLLMDNSRGTNITKQKNEIIELIDSSLINNKSYEELKKKIIAFTIPGVRTHQE